MAENVISILGCGWLGLPLAKALISEGYTLKGSSTRAERLPELREAGVRPYRVELSPELAGDDPAEFFDSDIAVFDFPPARGVDIEEWMDAQMDSLIAHLRQGSVKKVLFISSTSVYPATGDRVRESDEGPERENGRALLAAEKKLMNTRDFDTTVLRFCGLVGGERHPARSLARQKTPSKAEVPVNLIHRADCIAIIRELIHQERWGETFNACADRHPLRKELYTRVAKEQGFPVPDFEKGSAERGDFKIVDSSHLKERLAYRFHYPDPMDFPFGDQ